MQGTIYAGYSPHRSVTTQVGRGSEWGPIQVRGIWECVQYQRTSDRFLYTYRSGTKGQEKLVLLSTTKDSLYTEVRVVSGLLRYRLGRPPDDLNS